MKQRNLRVYVLPTIYVIILILIFGTVSLVTTLMKNDQNNLYSVDVLEDDSVPVVETEDKIVGVMKPYTNEKVTILKGFYDVEGDEKSQENALIYFKNTYMKNTGVFYTCNESFEIIAALDGTVLNIYKDDILGNVVEIEHNTNLRTIYYSLDKINVKVGDVLLQGDVIGTSGLNNMTDNKYNLLFEVYYNGALINPLEFYKMDASTLN